MVLLHGSFASSRWWEPFLSILPRAIRAFAPDLRGCGFSEKPDAGYTIPELSDDVWSFTQTLRLEDFDLVGHSSGGAIAAEFTLRHPNVVRTLTLVDSAPIEGVFTPTETLRVLDQMRTDRKLLRRALRILMPTLDMSGTTGALNSREFFDCLVDDATQMAPAAFSGIADALGQWNRFAEAKDLTLPTLVIWGELDQIVSRDAATRTLIAIPGANNLETLKNVGHSPMIESPVVLAERIIDFISEDYGGYDEIRRLVDNGDDYME
jgi:branched-chain amino acid transport system permease protein